MYPLKRPVGSSKCNRARWQICENFNEADTFTSTVTGNLDFICVDKCLIYLLTCNKSSKQNVGQAVDNFRSRWHNCLSNSRKYPQGETCLQEHLSTLVTMTILTFKEMSQ